jgi:toxin HigB-1
MVELASLVPPTISAGQYASVDLRIAPQYDPVVIKGFSDERTAPLFAGYATKGIDVQVQRRARTKLLMLDAAQTLADLQVPPGNRLEALRGYRGGQHSIRVNDQWRICFVWRAGEAWDVELVDYH